MDHLSHKASAAAAAAQTKMDTLATLNENTIYLMGVSFILGSLFTIFILLLLDFMKRDRVAPEAD